MKVTDLFEVEARNYDSDWDYYDDLYAKPKMRRTGGVTGDEPVVDRTQKSPKPDIKYVGERGDRNGAEYNAIVSVSSENPEAAKNEARKFIKHAFNNIYHEVVDVVEHENVVEIYVNVKRGSIVAPLLNALEAAGIEPSLGPKPTSM